MSADWTTWAADALVLLGLGVITVAVLGVLRFEDVYMQLHAAGKAAALGVLAVALAGAMVGELEVALRVLLVAAVTTVTAPVAAHAVGMAAAARQEPMRGPDTLDESGRLRRDEERERPGKGPR